MLKQSHQNRRVYLLIFAVEISIVRSSQLFENSIFFWKCKLFWFPFFFVKSWIFPRNEIDNPPSNFTGTTIQGISTNRYPETSTFVSYTVVNAKSGPPKSDWLEWCKKKLTLGNQTFLASVDRQKAPLGLCQIWWWIVYFLCKKIKI
jgi:hypothetical protein